MSTPLADLLVRRIAATGPITVADFMAECLLHPEHGYYTTRPAFGAEGDFITAPEISQMFGELAGLALAQAWQDQGSPPAHLVELGPGRGTLMADILRVLRAVPGALDALRPCLVEASPRLREVQADTLGPEAARAQWHDRISDIPTGPIFVVANEFFDALPIRQFERRLDGWRERMVGVRDGVLSFGLGGPTDPEAPVPAGALAEGTVLERCPAAVAIAAEIGVRIARQGGAALLIDYGGWDGTGDTLQAVRGHSYTPVLESPGEADLTAHVDFAALARAVETTGAYASSMLTQGTFLERLGITQRAQALARALSGPTLESHIAAHRRLTHPDEMGTLFKCLAVTPPGQTFPGFDA